MSTRRWFGVGSAVLLAGCQQTERVATGGLQLTRIPIVVQFDAPVTVSGPTRELCLVGSPGNVSAAAPGGTDVVRIVLLSARGARDTLAIRDVERRGDDMICFSDHGLEDRRPDSVTYVAVELSTSYVLRAREVRWWSGQRRKWFF